MDSSSDSQEEQIRQLEEQIKKMKLQRRHKKLRKNNTQVQSCTSTQSERKENVENPSSSLTLVRPTFMEDQYIAEEEVPSSTSAQPTIFFNDADQGNEGQTVQFPTYKKLPGAIDRGKEYEQQMCAFYVVKLIANDNVKHFEMTTNNKQHGLFDDIGIKIIFKNKKTTTFLFQLKHKEAAKPIGKHHLYTGKQKGDFDVEHYFNSMMSDIQVSEDTVCILFTNSPTNIEDRLDLSETIIIQKYDHLEHKDLLLNTQNTKKSTIFQVTEVDQNQVFYLFTAQNNLHSTKIKIEEMLRNLIQCDVYGSFIHFMSEWWSQNFVLTKNDIIAKLTELAFSPYMRVLNETKHNMKTINIKEAIMEFHITIVDAIDEDIVENIWQNIRITDEQFAKIRKKFVLNTNEQDKVLWYLDKVPLVVKVDNSNQITIKHVVELMTKATDVKKIVLVGGDAGNLLEGRDIFQNLSDLLTKAKNTVHCNNILHSFQISLQGREPINLDRLIKIDLDIAKHLRVGDLLKMSQETYLIGNYPDKLPDLHIPRSVSTIFVKTTTIFNVLESSQNQITVIINGNLKCRNDASRNKNFSTVKLSEYLDKKWNDNRNILLVSTKKQCTLAQFNQVCEKSEKSNVFLFKIFDQELCVLLLCKECKSLERFQNECKTLIEEDVLRKLDNSLNVICAPPGMGKSTLMQVLFNKCPSDCWGIYVDLINHNSFLAKKPSFEEIWHCILKTDEVEEKAVITQIKECLRRNKKIYLFLDGLDEIDSSYVNFILDFVVHESSNGINIWISSRENLRDQISQTLNVVPIEIKGLSKEQQEEYIREKLKGVYRAEEIEKILSAVFASTDLINSQELLGIPLQLHIITEMFLNNEEAYKNLEQKNIFVLTQMYRIFFEGKIKCAVCKVVGNKQEHQLGNLTILLTQYEIPALRQCLNGEDFDKLTISSEEIQEFIDHINTDGDKYGVIKKITECGDVIFVHQTFAEYFACVWLKKNKANTALLRRVTFSKEDALHRFTFSKKYEHLQLMFDVMLAESNPLHLSIIYKNLDQFEEHIDQANIKDQGGRTALHLLCTYGLLYPRYFHSTKLNREANWYRIMITKLLQQNIDICDKDNLFSFDCISYSLEASCLYPIEKILEQKFIHFEDIIIRILQYYRLDRLVYYCAQMGFSKLFYELISIYPHVLHLRVNGEYLLETAVKGTLDDNILPPREENIAVVKIILEHGVNINKKIDNALMFQRKMSETVLDIACKTGRYDMVKILVQNGAKFSKGNTVWHFLSMFKNCNTENLYLLKEFDGDVNITNDEGLTPLHIVCETSFSDSRSEKFQNQVDNCDVMKLLIDKGSDVNAKNHHGSTPLQIACQNCDIQITKILLLNGALINALDDENNNALHYAVQSWKDNRDIIELLITSIDINAPNQKGTTPFHLACKHSSVDSVKLLLKNKALANVADLDGNNALHYAVCLVDNNLEIIKLLIDNGLDVNFLNRSGTAPLHIACQYGMLENVAMLLKSNALVDVVNEDNKTALLCTLEKAVDEDRINSFINDDVLARSYARRQHVAEVTKLLLVNGASINAFDRNNNNALHHAAKSWRINKDIIELLIDNGIDLNAINSAGITVLQLACQNNDFEITQLLLEKGASINIVDQDKNNALHLAPWPLASEIVALLIHKGIDINTPNKNGSTALDLAFLFGDFGIVKLLLEKGASVHILDKDNNNALHHVSKKGLPPSRGVPIQLLIDNGVDVNATNKNGSTALHLACAAECGCLENVRVLLKNGALINALDKDNKNPLYYAIKSKFRSLSIIKLLISEGIDINARDKQGVTVLHLACELGFLEVVEVLLDNDASINVRDKDNNNALHYALGSCKEHIIKLLIVKNIDVNAPNTNGRTAFHLACFYNNFKIAKLLLNNDALINARDKNNNNALHYALSSSHAGRNIIKLLIDIGIDVNTPNNDGKTLLHLGCRNNGLEITNMLLENGACINSQDKKNNNALHYALLSKCNIHVNTLIDKGIHINTQNDDGVTALHLACRNADRQSVLYILNRNVQFDTTDKDNNNALHYAAQSTTENVYVICQLINIGFNVNVQNKDGTTALQFACRAGNFSNVGNLLTNKAEVNIVDREQNNALHYAALSKCGYEVIDVLTIRRADVNSQNSFGSTPLHLACNAGNQRNVEELLNNDGDVNLLDNCNKSPVDYATTDEMKILFQSTGFKIQGTNEWYPYDDGYSKKCL